MFTLNCKGRLLLLDTPLVMGIINITPDSFFEGSRFVETDKILQQIEKMINEEVDIIDVGGQSTRPGSNLLSTDEELQRIIPAIEAIIKRFPEALLSVDSFYSKVAGEAVAAGASIVNDISAGNMDAEMTTTVALLHVPYIIMHMQRTPQTMQQNPMYSNVTKDVLDFFIQKTDECKKKGIHDVIIDPGFGFGKTVEHNFELLKNLSFFKMLDKAIMIGLSRKSTIYKPLGITADEALNGTTVLNTIALMNGANILRVHDVKQAKEAVKLFCRL
jgi:dihydropteroate synthase